MTPSWHNGNQVRLLENGEAFFPLVYQAIDEARHEILAETFILGEDKVGRELARRLIAAARRGVRVELTVDAWGSMGLSDEFMGALTSANVCVHLFEERQLRWVQRVAWFRRLHRKLLIVDGERAFIGGINFSADHLLDFGPAAKQDYSVCVTGPVVAEMHAFALEAITSVHDDVPESPGRSSTEPGRMQVRFVARDNRAGHRNAIERQYRAAIRGARQRLIIANAYFFPGYLLLREIRRAARRGVDVRLLTQGETDMPIARFCARLLYEDLQKSGVRIYEYRACQFHGKVAVVDDDWATVGSSNLDPLSLWFNLEANIIVRDGAFNRAVYDRISALLHSGSREVERISGGHRVSWRPAAAFVAFHFLRRFPRVAGLLPAHRPHVTRAEAPATNADA